jgi:hypothetical protein
MGSGSYRNFASILDDLATVRSGGDDEVTSADEAGATPSIPFDYLSVADELHSGKIRAALDPAAVRYGDAVTIAEYELQALLDDISIEPDEEPPAVDLPEATDPTAISAELALAEADLPRLAAIRRRFAFANHPDRLPPHLRPRALQRMQVANMLIDEAEQRLSANAG